MRRRRRQGDSHEGYARLEFYARYPSDWRAKTSHLTREADYAYGRIIDEIFLRFQDTCEIPDDDVLLMGIARVVSPEEWKLIRHVLIDGPMPLLQKTDHGTLTNRRLAEEVAAGREAMKKATEKAQKGGLKSAEKRAAKRQPDPTTGSPSGEPQVEPKSVSTHTTGQQTNLSVLDSRSESSPSPAGEGSPGGVGGFDAAAVGRIVPKIMASAMDPLPPEQLAVAWVTRFGEELIGETLADTEANYGGKHFNYFFAILEKRERDPSQRPGARAGRRTRQPSDQTRGPVDERFTRVRVRT